MAAFDKATSTTPDGVRLQLRLTPKASRDAIQGFADEADGGAVLKCSVTTVPEDGKANVALIKMLAKAWKVPRSSIELVSGATDRRKTVLIRGEAVDVLALLRDKLCP
jgi:uncharacterized protein (TIGR00251 family)